MEAALRHAYPKQDEFVYILGGYPVGDRSAEGAVTYADDDLQAVLGDEGKWQFARKNGTPC